MWCSRTASLLSALLLAGCAYGTVGAGGHKSCMAIGNGAWTSCDPEPTPTAPVATVRMDAVTADPPLPDPGPQPILTPVNPLAKPGCTICQGGNESIGWSVVGIGALIATVLLHIF